MNLNTSEANSSSNLISPVPSSYFLFLLHWAQKQQIFQQRAENVLLISQAIIAEKNAMANAQKQQKEINNGTQSSLNDSNKKDFFTRCGITWTYLTSTRSINEFDDLRRRHQVSKNRHVGYGIRYACTRNAKARDNCPYLLLNIPGKNGIQHVYSRNSHTHPVRHIRSRIKN